MGPRAPRARTACRVHRQPTACRSTARPTLRQSGVRLAARRRERAKCVRHRRSAPRRDPPAAVRRPIAPGCGTSFGLSRRSLWGILLADNATVLQVAARCGATGLHPAQPAAWGTKADRPICGLYAPPPHRTSKIYVGAPNCCGQTAVVSIYRALTRVVQKRTLPMLDLIYLVIGAVFLGACVLYGYACDIL